MAGPARNAHGTTVRGLTLSRGSESSAGNLVASFGRCRRPISEPTIPRRRRNLLALGIAMVADHDDPRKAPMRKKAAFPASTYLGQFIDHDLTFDPASSLQQQDDPDGLVDFRTPRFDLDNSTARGPTTRLISIMLITTFILGRTLTGAASNPNARDLPRKPSRPGAARRGSMTPGALLSAIPATTKISSFRSCRDCCCASTTS